MPVRQRPPSTYRNALDVWKAAGFPKNAADEIAKLVENEVREAISEHLAEVGVDAEIDPESVFLHSLRPFQRAWTGPLPQPVTQLIRDAVERLAVCEQPRELTRLLWVLKGSSGPVNESLEAKLYQALYSDLKRIAAAAISADQKLSRKREALDIVHEMYLRFRSAETGYLPADRGVFLGLARQAIKNVIRDLQKAANRQKRPQTASNITLTNLGEIVNQAPQDDFVCIEALEQLGKINPREKLIVELRAQNGLSIEEIAEELQISTSTVKRDLAQARVHLSKILGLKS